MSAMTRAAAIAERLVGWRLDDPVGIDNGVRLERRRYTGVETTAPV